MRKTKYYILSGKGENGHWSGPFETTLRGARTRADLERAVGACWAKVYEVIHGVYLQNVDDGAEMRDIPWGPKNPEYE